MRKALIVLLMFAPAALGQDPAARDVRKLPVAQQQYYLAGQRAMEWLRRCNRPDGRFVYGFLPALCVPMTGDDDIAQAEAAAALARAGRYYHDEPATAVARQALLTLLLETTVDPKEPRVRMTAAPPSVLNRLASHGLLVRAIHELAAPGRDLLDQGDQLANYLYQQQRADGSLQVEGTGDDVKSEAHHVAAGQALYGIILSQRHRPATWKPETLRKARAFYLARWQAQKNLPLVVSQAPAFAEAYLATKEPAFADAVFTLCDWLVAKQLQATDARHKAWAGGFPPWVDGRLSALAPDIRSASCAECLAQACRVAQAAGDVARYERYGAALEATLLFLLTLQYTPDRTRHYVEEFRPAVRGAFHASAQDGNLRLDYTAVPLAALALYLDQVAPGVPLR